MEHLMQSHTHRLSQSTTKQYPKKKVQIPADWWLKASNESNPNDFNPPNDPRGREKKCKNSGRWGAESVKQSPETFDQKLLPWFAGRSAGTNGRLQQKKWQKRKVAIAVVVGGPKPRRTAAVTITVLRQPNSLWVGMFSPARKAKRFGTARERLQ